MKKELLEKKYLESQWAPISILYRLWKGCPKHAFEVYRKSYKLRPYWNNKRKVSNKQIKAKFDKIVSFWNEEPYKIGDKVHLKGYKWYNFHEAGVGLIVKIDSDGYAVIDWKIHPAVRALKNRSLFHVPTELCIQKNF